MKPFRRSPGWRARLPSPPPRDGEGAIRVFRSRRAGRHARHPRDRPKSFIASPPVPATVQIVFLGTSGSWPTPKRNVSAIAIKRGPEVILFDCGEGTQRQFMLSKLSFMQVSRVFLTHFTGTTSSGSPGWASPCR